MRRRAISLGSLLVAVVALGVVLYNATLVDRRPPSITRVSLSAAANGQGDLAETLTAIDVEFSEPVQTGSVERRFRIVPYVAGTFSWDGSTAIFTPSAKLPQDTAFAVFVDPGFEDPAGNVAATGLDGWAFRTVGPPVVVEADPADGAERIPVEANLTISFDRLMDTRSVEGAVGIEPVVPVRAAWSGQSVTLTFEQELLFGTTYRVTVGTTAAATDGSRLAVPFTTRFTTVSAGLEVIATVPAGGVSGASIRTPIAVLFDGPIDPASVADALQITPAVGGQVRVVPLPSDATPRTTPAVEGPASVLLFEPAAPLTPHTTYSLTLASTVARPGAPGEVAAGRTWIFTTGQPTVSGQNQVAFLSARSGVRNVWLMNPDGSNPRQLTTELVPVAGFDVTGDGSRIAWSAGGTIRTMRIDGTEQSTLTDTDRLEYAPAFSPNGRSLVVGRRDVTGADLGYWLVPLDGAGGERTLVATGAPPLGSVLLTGDGIGAGEGTPAWARRSAFDPTGRWLLLTTGSGEVRLVDLAAADLGTSDVDTGVVALAGPAWSAELDRFVVVGRRSGEAADSLYVIDLAGAAARRTAAAGSIAAGADGLVAFLARDAAGGTHVAVVRPNDATPPRSLTETGDLWDRWPAFSPDGRSVLFGRVRADGGDASAGIWTVDVRTGSLSPLAADGAYPRWLP